MRIPLIWKLLALQLVILLAVIATIWVSISSLASDYFMTLMEKFNLDAPEVNSMFLDANKRALVQVGIAAMLVSGVLCFWLTRRLLAPLRQMAKGTERIAAGDYEGQIPISSRDELADLAASFNRMAQSLARMEQLRNRMVIDVAHELRTPLTNLRGYIEALQDGLVEPSRKVMDTLHEELLRLVRLTEDLLETARCGVRAERPRRQIEVVPHLVNTLDLFRPRLRRRNITVHTALNGNGTKVLADSDQLQQVFGNLLQNCLQYAPENSWVKVSATQQQGNMHLVFSNPAEDISDQDLSLLFEPYYRADKSRSRDTGGAGIGLTIVQSIIESHGGKVGAESKSGETSVWIDLPASST